MDTSNTENTANDAKDFESMLAKFEKEGLKEGEIVKGRVLKVEKDFVLVDVSFKSEGHIPIHEFRGLDGLISVKEGDEISVYVESIENDEGAIELSKEKASKLKIWDDISAAAESNLTIEGIVISKVKGGLTVDIGVKAFLPGSQIDLRPIKNLDQFIGRKMPFKVIKFNKRRGNIVLSHRAILEKEREEQKAKTLQHLEVNQIVTGTVKNITDYGCFVDLGGIDGLLHITDMSWGRINHPSEMFKVGDVVKVQILKFDNKAERVSLGMKQLMEDPWKVAERKYKVGDRVKGKVVNFTDYGAFVEIEQGVEGLIHVSDMSWTKKIKHPSNILTIGHDVEAVILEMDPVNKKLAMGLKQTEINPWILIQEKYPPGARVRGKVKSITNFGVFIGVEEGIDGLVHLQDLSWSHKLKSAKEIIKVGDEVDAVVLNIDPAKERFTLGIKQLSSDPWEKAQDRFPLGSIVEGKVTKILDFGAIVELTEEIEGLVHISELRPEKVESVSKVLKDNDVIKAMVINLIPDERKIGLSIRRYMEAEESGAYQEFVKAQRHVPTTLGELIKEKIDISQLPKTGESGETKPRKTKPAPRKKKTAVEEAEVEAKTEEIPDAKPEQPVEEKQPEPPAEPSKE
jgi:small subunit ribosomal protein S1